VSSLDFYSFSISGTLLRHMLVDIKGKREDVKIMINQLLVIQERLYLDVVSCLYGSVSVILGNDIVLIS
jgi:hypothetical protein